MHFVLAAQRCVQFCAVVPRVRPGTPIALQQFSLRAHVQPLLHAVQARVVSRLVSQ